LLKALHSSQLSHLQIIDLPLDSLYRSHWSLAGRAVPTAESPDAAVYLPGRNVLLISAAAIRCAEQGIHTIALGLLKGNPFQDASPRFLTQLAGCLTDALNHPIRILTPLRQLGKAQVIRAAAHVPLRLTFSCLNPVGLRHCGRCNKCAERWSAFHAAGIADPTRYASQRALHTTPVPGSGTIFVGSPQKVPDPGSVSMLS
jgi:7-cyano-7-deazaguanine synthase